MGVAELIVSASIWLSLCCYPAGLLGAASPEDDRIWRRIWTTGSLLFVIHTVSAFAVHYDWSHAVALEATAADTANAVGVASGAGLYLNYLFGAIWLVDACWWWLRPGSYRRRSRWVILAEHVFLLFMIVNGAIVFVEGWSRVLGVLISVAGIGSLWTFVRADR